jgi:rare lipoprotein A
MQTLREPPKTVAPIAHLSWLFHAVAHIACAMVFPIGCAMVFVVGCSNARSLENSPAGSTLTYPSTPTYRSDNSSNGQSSLSTRIVTASWYGPGYVGKTTASGERFDPNRLTAASKTLPLGSFVRVTNLQNGRSVKVKVNDRGPHVRGRGLDLSPAAAHKIGLADDGVAHVKVTPVREPRARSTY